MEDMNQTEKKRNIPEWVIREGYLPPKVKVLCPDEEHFVMLRGQSAQQKGELEAKKNSLSDWNYTKVLLRNCFLEWSLVDMDNQPLPQLNETAKGPDEDQKIWNRLPAIWVERMLAGVVVLEFPGGDDVLGGDMLKALIPRTDS